MFTQALPHQVKRAILQLFEDLSTPTSLKMYMLLKAGEWDQLATQRVDPKHYPDRFMSGPRVDYLHRLGTKWAADRFWRDAMAVDSLRKLQSLPTSFDRKAVAEQGFLSCERSCFRANERLQPYLSGTLYEDAKEGLNMVFYHAREKIAEILGPCPSDQLEGKFGPGSTFGDRGQFCTVPDKLSTSPTITSDAWPYLFNWVGTSWASACASSGKDPSFIPGNRFTTVNKDSTKDRGICIEPSLNVFYQLGYGRVMRQRLLRAGIDLRNGQDIHKRVACEASIRGHLVTMDLSNASDTICKNLVKLLLPTRWFGELNRLRSPKTLFGGHWYLLEKFSSMGNGFTFELETLIFLGLIYGLHRCFHKELTVGEDLFVYGDDIIFPPTYSNEVISLLGFCGMSVNERKTFVDGPFRESCGGDYFGGVDVRPFFLEESPNEPQQLISLANGLRRASRSAEGRSSVVRRAWFGVLDCIPNHIRSLRGPEVLGDLCVHDDQERWRVRWRSGIRYIKVWRPARFRKVSYRNFRPQVVLASALYGSGSGLSAGVPWDDRAGVTPRDAVLGYKVGWVPRS
jgi:hypothetical protein